MVYFKKMPQRLNLFLTSVHFKGFKSIKDLRVVGLKKGLNILIGKNGSGKSNFLECVSKVMSTMPRSILRTPYKYAEIEFISSDKSIIKWECAKEIHNQPHLFSDNKDFSNELNSPEDRTFLREKLFINKKIAFDSSSSKNSFEYKNKTINIRGRGVKYALRDAGFSHFDPLYIKFNLPVNLDCIDSSGTLNIDFSEGEIDAWSYLSTLRFLRRLFLDIEISYAGDLNKIRSITKSSLLKQLKISSEIKENIKKYTPIQDIKFNENINI